LLKKILYDNIIKGSTVNKNLVNHREFCARKSPGFYSTCWWRWSL